ncbi:golgin subfamily A member 4-like isoform X2 [Silurus meridionalis]|uniref:golgin subfamily A member 4-like isoform X2 n=1 Tax=Silurus meridionalis TaxID=175797 RepID=UPI001EEC4BAC|nr:golgin subfamily A member 4-like isoform X2 [Silurus meridionalis]
MRNLFHLVQASVLKLPLRPLLYTCGAGAATAIIYYFVCIDGKTDADPDETSGTEDSPSPSPSPLPSPSPSPSEVPQDQAMVPPAPCSTAEISKDKPALKYEEAQLEIENLINHVETLKDTVQDMKTQMYEIQNEHNQDQERIRKAQNILQLKLEETTKKLEQLSECERELVAYQNLTTEFNNSKVSLTDIKSLIKISLDQMWEEHHKATESFINLQFEKSSLMKDMKIMKGTVQDMGSLIYKTQKKQDEEYKQMVQDYSTLHLEQEEIKKSINEGNMLLKISKDETVLKYQEAQLEIENLKNHVETLRDTVQDMKTHIYEIKNKQNQEQEREQKAHKALQLEHKETMKKLQHCKELLSSSSDQVWEKHQKAMESFINLQFENSNLMKDVGILKSRIQDMTSLIYETQKEQEEEYTRVIQDYNTLHLEQEQMKRSLNQSKLELKNSNATQNFHCMQSYDMLNFLVQNKELLQIIISSKSDLIVYVLLFLCLCLCGLLLCK